MESQTHSVDRRIRRKRINPRWRRHRTKRITFALLLVVLVAALALALSGYRWWLERSAKLQEVVLQTPDLEVSEIKVDRSQAVWHLTGRVRNRSIRNYRDVEASFLLVGRAGNAFDTALIRTSSLRAGESWNFRTEIKEAIITAIRLRELTGTPE